MNDIDFRTAKASDIRSVLRWAAEEGWNPGLDDAEAFQATDPAGFFVATDNRQPVAAISVVNHSDTFAFLGLYLCRLEYRGKGIGFGLWKHALKHAGDRTVGLDGVPAQETNYAKSGFVLAGRTLRLEGKVPDANFGYPVATGEDLNVIMKLDRTANGFDRSNFLNAWTANCLTRKTVVLSEKGTVTGFATARICEKGCKIGPIVAPTPEDAYHLAVEAAATVGQTDVIIDTPHTATGLERLLREKGFVETFSTARMYRGTAPTVATGLQAIATMELG
jgi:GNAT superfamily N-acetyltransferase